MAGFEGFPEDFFAFFRELKANNNRAWFEDNKQRYRDSVQAPMSSFIEAMAPRLVRLSKSFRADPRPNGGSMFRIHRDVRFARDKRPYKEHAACQFRHVLAKDAHAPGFYMHFAPDEVFFGGGLWVPEARSLAPVRGAIAAEPAAWKKAVTGKAFAKTFEGLLGEKLSRPPQGFDASHPFIEDIKRKSFFVRHYAEPKLARSPRLVGEVDAAFKTLGPLMKFLCGSLGVPY